MLRCGSTGSSRSGVLAPGRDLRVQRAADGQAAAVEDVRIDHGGLHVAMAEQVLHCANVVAVFQQVGGEGVAQGVGGDVLGQVGEIGGPLDGLAQTAGRNVVASAQPGAGIGGNLGRGEDPLPGPIPAGRRVFTLECGGHVDGTEPIFEVVFVKPFDAHQVTLESVLGASGQDGDAILLTFSIPDDDLVLGEIELLDPQAHALADAKSGAVEQFGHQHMVPGQAGEQRADFLGGEDGWQAFWSFSAHGFGLEFEGLVEDVPIEVEDCAEGLVLGGGGDVFIDGEVGEEEFQVLWPHVDGVAFAVEEDEAADPAQVSLLGLVGVVHAAERFAGALEQRFLGHGPPLSATC